ncbi:MAG: hypothetical protein WBM86_05335, partial [Waterburya sp.]
LTDSRTAKLYYSCSTRTSSFSRTMDSSKGWLAHSTATDAARASEPGLVSSDRPITDSCHNCCLGG